MVFGAIKVDGLKASLLKLPVLIGPSRKSFIGNALNEKPENRIEGTSAAVAAGILKGASIVRVHDVSQIRKVVKMKINAEGNP